MTPDRRTVPPTVVAIGLTASLLFLLPLLGLAAKVPWPDLVDVLGERAVTDALRLSLVTSAAAAALSVALGVPLALVLSRVRFTGRPLLRAVVTLPMVLPPVVGGAALLFAFGRRGLIGEPLDDVAGIVLPFSTLGVVLANTFVAMPFLVITVQGALDGMDRRFEDAAATLGASRFTVLRRITLPMIGPSVAAGTVLAWARALGEFGATITFAGNLQGETQTLPLAVFVSLSSGPERDAALAMSLLMVVVSLVVLVALRDRWWRRS